MKLSTKSRYAVMAIVDICCNSKGKPISLQEIAKRQHIALNYLEQIFVKLRKGGIVNSVKGPGGGYTLARGITEIKIAEIIIAMDDSFKMTRCSVGSGCLIKGEKCFTHNIWEGLEKNIMNYFNSISLQDVVNEAGINKLAQA